MAYWGSRYSFRQSAGRWHPGSLDRGEIVRFGGTDLPGETLADAPIRETDCFLVAVERDGDFLLDVSPQTVLESDVSVILAGDDEAID